MKANELMIGDWYAFRGHPYKCTASDIESIAECEEKGAQTDISEIPITPEILKKNGFKQNEQFTRDCLNPTFHLGRLMYIVIEPSKSLLTIKFEYNNGDKVLNTFSVIHYVHELQRVLRFCGIEKEIVL